MAAKRKQELPTDPLDVLVAGGLSEALKLVFWTQRFQNPDFTLTIHPKDIEGFKACTEYLSVEPTVNVFRPGGVPATEGQPARGNRRAIAPREAIPPKDYVVIQMVGKDGNSFKPIENNQGDRDRQIEAERVRRVKETAGSLAGALERDLATQTYSDATIREAIVALRTLGMS